MVYFLSLLPIFILIILSLTKGVKQAVIVGFAVTSILFFYWEASFSHFLGSMGVAFLTTVNILMIVFGALFLYNIMQGAGLISQISHSLDNLHPSKEIRFFLLAICLTAFFEGVAGFGTPGAIVPLLLIAMGFNAVLSVSVVLLFDGLFAIFGAVGTPILTGLQLPLDLSHAQVQQIGFSAAVIGVIVQFFILFAIFRMFAQMQNPVQHKGKILILFTFFALPFCLFAWLVPDLATVLASLVMLILSIFYLKGEEGKINLRPWLPYGILAILLLLPKLFYPLNRWIGWDVAFMDMFGSGLNATIKPLQSPLLPFIIVGIGVALYNKSKSFYLVKSSVKLWQVFVVLFPSVAVAQLMINSGVQQPSMVNNIADLLSNLGSGYTLLSPLLGIIGAFITGSTTISNVVFGPSQLETAKLLNLDANMILSLQLNGAGIGNAICLFNIIAAASVANLKNYKEVLARNIAPAILAGLIAGFLGWCIIQIL
ncbi:L-lactate permease [Gillisia sp. Q332]|uniref:L-lactate permease n=1 Tax=Gillisia xinjiangensis TaxID=3384765 RepID=UPI00391AA553